MTLPLRDISSQLSFLKNIAFNILFIDSFFAETTANCGWKLCSSDQSKLGQKFMVWFRSEALCREGVHSWVVWPDQQWHSGWPKERQKDSAIACLSQFMNWYNHIGLTVLESMADFVSTLPYLSWAHFTAHQCRMRNNEIGRNFLKLLNARKKQFNYQSID